MSKSAWTCSRGRPPPGPGPGPGPGPPGPVAFFPSLPSTSPPARASASPPRNVMPTQDARRDVACSAVTCRTSDDRRSRRSVTSAPERESSTCASRLDSPSRRRAAASSAAAAALSASRSDANVSDAHVTARLDRGLAPWRLNALRSAASMRSAGAASMVAGAPRSAAAARAASLAPALPSESSRSTTTSCSGPPSSTARSTSSSASSPPLGGRNPLESTSEALGRSFGSGASSAATSAVCCGNLARKSSGATPATSAAPLEPLFGFAARSAPSSTARSIPVENRRSIS